MKTWKCKKEKRKTMERVNSTAQNNNSTLLSQGIKIYVELR